jgi:trigger factor
MTESHELKSVSEDTMDQKPEDVVPEGMEDVTNVPGVAEKLKEKLKDVDVSSIQVPQDQPLPKDRVDKLATPYRAVLWRKYEDLKVLFDKFWDDHEENIVRNLKIKGRKGPGGKQVGARKMAEQRVTVSKLYRQVLAELLKDAIDGDILFFDGMELFDYEKGKPAQIVGVFYYMPEIDFTGDLNLECVRPPIPPLDDQLKIRYMELQRQFRVLSDDPDGVITENSSVKLDITATLEGEPYKSGTVQQQWIDVSGIPSEDLVKELIGHKVGDLFECSYLVTRHDPANAGKTLQATIKVHGLQKINIPDVNDDLAKDAGFDDLISFKKKFAEDYTKYTENALQATAVDHVINQIVRGSKVPEVPQEWVEIQVDQRVEGALKSVGGNKKSLLQSHMCRDEDELRHRIRGQIYNDVMQRCAVKWYQATYNVAVDEEDAFYKSILSNVKWVERDEKE